VLEERVESGGGRPKCLSGDRRCPPEDCGGIWSYQEVLEALAGSSSLVSGSELADWLEWAGPGFDPAVFDLDATNKGLSYY
jgi:hypothetical protein